jgi:iron complex outermembrane receptor protein
MRRATPPRTALADCTVQHGDLEGLGAGAGIRYTGSTLDFTNETRTPDHLLVDAAAHYSGNNLTFQLNVQNLFDKVYVNACDFYCHCGQRRSVTRTLKVKW